MKSIGRDYGFIDCPAVSAHYGCDVFVHKAQIGEGAYFNLSVGEVRTRSDYSFAEMKNLIDSIIAIIDYHFEKSLQNSLFK